MISSNANAGWDDKSDKAACRQNSVAMPRIRARLMPCINTSFTQRFEHGRRSSRKESPVYRFLNFPCFFVQPFSMGEVSPHQMSAEKFRRFRPRQGRGVRPVILRTGIRERVRRARIGMELMNFSPARKFRIELAHVFG